MVQTAVCVVEAGDTTTSPLLPHHHHYYYYYYCYYSLTLGLFALSKKKWPQPWLQMICRNVARSPRGDQCTDSAWGAGIN